MGREEAAPLGPQDDAEAEGAEPEIGQSERRDGAVIGLADEVADDRADQRRVEADEGGRRAGDVAERLHRHGVEVRHGQAHQEVRGGQDDAEEEERGAAVERQGREEEDRGHGDEADDAGLREPPHAEAPDEAGIGEGGRSHAGGDQGEGKREPAAEVVDVGLEDLLRHAEIGHQAGHGEAHRGGVADGGAGGHRAADAGRDLADREGLAEGRAQRLGHAQPEPHRHDQDQRQHADEDQPPAADGEDQAAGRRRDHRHHDEDHHGE